MVQEMKIKDSMIMIERIKNQDAGSEVMRDDSNKVDQEVQVDTDLKRVKDIIYGLWNEHKRDRKQIQYTLKKLLESKNMSIVKKYLGNANEKSKFVTIAFSDSLTKIEEILEDLKQPQKLPDEHFRII